MTYLDLKLFKLQVASCNVGLLRFFFSDSVKDKATLPEGWKYIISPRHMSSKNSQAGLVILDQNCLIDFTKKN